MKTTLILALLITLALPATALELPGLGDAKLGAAYAYSFGQSRDLLVGKLSVEIAKLGLFGRDIPITCDLLALAEQPDAATLGVGISATLIDLEKTHGFSVGIGWLPKDYGWTITIGVLNSVF